MADKLILKNDKQGRNVTLGMAIEYPYAFLNKWKTYHLNAIAM